MGKVGPNSEARYVSQHYNASSAAGTLAGSILRNPAAVGAGDLQALLVGQWIREQTDRINLLVAGSLGDSFLSLLEEFLRYRWRPVFEGRS